MFAMALFTCWVCTGATAMPQCVSVTIQPEARQMVDNMKQMSSSAAELSFMQNMIRMDLGAVEMSKQAASRGTHTELSLFARRIVDERDAEMNRFVSMILTLYGDGVYSASKPTAEDSKAAGRFDRCNCGFEAGYMLAMIRHEAGALAVAREMQRQSTHGRLKQAAQRIVTERSANIEKLRSLLKCWYGIDASVIIGECVQC